MVSASIGERIAIARRRRGLSQTVLANLIGRSESWLSQVERGIRSVDRLPVLIDLAGVLHVEVETLLGRPWKLAPNGSGTPDELGDVRRYLNGYSHLFPMEPLDTKLSHLRADVFAGHQEYQAAHYSAAAMGLAGLLTDVDALHQHKRPRGSDAVSVYVSGYILAAKLLRKLGATDLAMIAADRASAAATEGESIADRVLTGYQVVASLLRADQVDDAETLALRLATLVEPVDAQDDPELISALGSVWLLSAVIAARRTEQYEAARAAHHRFQVR